MCLTIIRIILITAVLTIAYIPPRLIQNVDGMATANYNWLELIAASNKYVLNIDLKWSIVLALFTPSGNLFQRTGPATQEDSSPCDLYPETGICNCICLDRLSDLADAFMDIRLHR